jgi:hypothetical protein
LRERYRKVDYCNLKKCQQLHQNFSQAAAEFNELKDLKKFPTCFRYDPSFFAHRITRKNVLMFNAIFDKLIPRESADDLWQRLGERKRYNFIFIIY